MSGNVQIRGYADVASFAARVEPWLALREAEHNLLLGLLPRLLSAEHEFGRPIYLASIEIDGGIDGCAFRTPPQKLCLTRLPEASIAPLVDHVSEVYPELPAVLGPEEAALPFADLWSRKNGCRWSLAARQRLHALERVTPPERTSAGRLRPAGDADLPLLLEWMEAFLRDTGDRAADSRTRTAQLLRQESIYLWEDGEPRSMLATPGRTLRGVRVGYVYTPGVFRRRGYATAAVASLSERLLREGRRFCCLYTDLSNPTSNAIYARIGYEPVCDVVDVSLPAGDDA